ELGGDAFGYHWVDPDHLAIYLLDVCGHGVGAALLSVSVLNAVRSQGLAGSDPRLPDDALRALNRAFPMDRQNNLFFSMWYGVYRPSKRELRFASGGHPPALLLTADTAHAPSVHPLITDAPALGCFDQAAYTPSSVLVPPKARLLVFSDGVFEIFEGS